MRRVLKYGLIPLAALVAIIAAALLYLQTQSGRELLVAKIEAAASTGTDRLEIGELAGFVPFDFRITGVAMSDREGRWLTIDRVDLAWSPLALLGSRAEIDGIEIGKVTLARAPVSEPSAEPEPSEPFTFPSLPVAVELRRLAIGEMALGAPILGEPASFTATAQASLGDASRGLSLQLNLERRDGGTDIVDAKVTYVPATDQLDLALMVHEPRGGLLTKMMGLPGPRDFKIDAFGDGPLADWQGDLVASLDGASLATINAQVTGNEDRLVKLQADLAPAPLLPPDVASLVAGGLTLTTEMTVPEAADAIDIHAFDLKGEVAQISAQGLLGWTRDSDLSLTVTADNAAALSSFLPDITWQSSTVDGQVTGTWPALEVTTTATVAGLDAAGRHIDTIDLAATIDSDDLLQQSIAFDLLVDAVGFALGSPEAEALLADGLKLGASGSFDMTGRIDAEAIDLQAGPIGLNGAAQATAWGAELTATAHLAAPDLGRVPAGGEMKLAGSVSADVVVASGAAGLSLQAKGTAMALATGIAPLDGLLGAEPAFDIALTRDAAGVLDLETFALTGKAVTASARGKLAGDILAFDAEAALSDLAALDPAASGSLALRAGVTGTEAAPILRLDLTSPKLAYDTFSASRLQLNVTAENVVAAPRAQITGAAEVMGQPARLAAGIAQDPATGNITVSDLALRHGPTGLSGNLRLVAGIADGSLRLAIADLAPYAGLAGTALGGSLMADVRLANNNGQQDVALDVGGEELAAASLRIATAKVSAQVSDAMGRQEIEARADLANVTADALVLDTVSATAEGEAVALDITLSAEGPEISLDTAAQLARTADSLEVEIARLSAAYRGETFALRKPARVAQSGETLTVADVDLGYGEGGVTIDGTLAPGGNDLSVSISRLPLSLLRLVMPDQQVAGELNGSVSLGGSRAAPTGAVKLVAENVSFDRNVTMAVNLDGDWRGGALRSQGRLAFSTGGALDLAANLGLGADPASGLPQLAPNAPLDASAAGDLDLALANRFIAGGADRIAGKLRVDLAANGRVDAPRVAGSAVLSDGRYENVRYGIKLKNLAMELRGNGDRFEVVSLSANTPGRGSITGSGSLSLQGDMPIEVAIKAVQAQVINTDTAFAIVDADLQLVGAAKTEVALTGQVTVPKSEIRIPDRLPASVQEIAYVEVNVPPERAQAIQEAQQPPAKTLGVKLDIRIDVPQQMAIRGRGLDAEMEGHLAVTGTADLPIVVGEVAMRRGTLDLVGRRLTFERGKVEFDGAEKIDPILDFMTRSKANNYDITINVGGRASFPKITLSSTPPLPEDEVLSQLLFEKSSGALSPFEALQLAKAAAELAGVDTGVGMLDAVRGATGLDQLSVDAGDGKTGPSVSAGRYVSEGVYVGVKQGAGTATSAATVEIEVTPNVKVETELGADSSKAGVNWEWDY